MVQEVFPAVLYNSSMAPTQEELQELEKYDKKVVFVPQNYIRQYIQPGSIKYGIDQVRVKDRDDNRTKYAHQMHSIKVYDHTFTISTSNSIFTRMDQFKQVDLLDNRIIYSGYKCCEYYCRFWLLLHIFPSCFVKDLIEGAAVTSRNQRLVILRKRNGYEPFAYVLETSPESFLFVFVDANMSPVDSKSYHYRV